MVVQPVGDDDEEDVGDDGRGCCSSCVEVAILSQALWARIDGDGVGDDDDSLRGIEVQSPFESSRRVGKSEK